MNQNACAPQAILWDMDGTLIDTEPYWIQAEISLCSEFGGTWTHEDGLAIIGTPLAKSAAILRSRGVDLPIPEVIQRLQDEVSAGVRRDAPWQEDARRLLDRTVAAGIPCALVTMSYPQLANALLEQAPVFDAVVTGDMVTKGKPDPESYLKAAQMLGVPIERCLAIEDSRPGVASAHASGARTVAVMRLSVIDQREGLSRVRSLDRLTDDVLADIMGGAVIDDLAEETPGST